MYIVLCDEVPILQSLRRYNYAQQILEKLETESTQLDWKVCDVVEEMDNLRCGFDSLKEDMTVLESASSQLLALSSEIQCRIMPRGTN